VNYDIILTLCPPTDSPVLTRKLIRKNKKLQNTRWIQYWSDPVTISMLDMDNKLPLKRYLHRFIERMALRNADEIIYCTPLLCESQKNIHPKISHKMRWVDVGYVSQYSDCPKNGKSSSKVMNIGYYGNYNESVRNIVPLFKAMSKVESGILSVCGDTNIDNINYRNVNALTGRLPYSKVKELEMSSDILICLCNISGVQIPGKIFYYASYSKPIVVILDGYHQEEINKYLAEFNRYILCKNNEVSIVGAIKKAIEMIPTFSSILPERLKPEKVAESILKAYQ